MKKDIHPPYYENVEVICICGNRFTVNAAVPGPIKVEACPAEACPACHPAYTGEKVTTVVKGRMEKFLEKQKKIEELQKKRAQKAA